MDAQFNLQFVFKSLLSYLGDLCIHWDHGETYHFMGLEIECTIKILVFNHVLAGKVVIKDASHFAEYDGNLSKTVVLYLDKNINPNL